MKTYSITQLKRLAKEQGYKVAALEDQTGKRLQAFNRITISVNSQLDTLASRLSSEIYEDGEYYILLARSIKLQQDPDKYLVRKGAIKDPVIPAVPIVQPTKAEQVLTWENALSMQQQIATLKSEVLQLKHENNILQSELDAYEEQEENLSEGRDNEHTKSSVNTFLSETVPSMLPILEKFFENDDKKIALRTLELQTKLKAKKKIQPIRKPIVTGSQEHLNIIEHYFKTKQQQKLDAQLDKLFEFSEPLYIEVCTKLGIDPEIEEEEEEEEEEQNNE